MKYTLQIQQDQIAEATRARYAMVIPILTAMLLSTKRHIVEQAGGYDGVTLEMFTRIYIEHAGDHGICFEYAVHQCIQERDPAIHPIISSVLEEFCGVKGGAESILFGIEKHGPASVLETAKGALTDDSRVLVGKRGKPARLKPHLENIVRAHNSRIHMERLPSSIRGLWKADLFVGNPGPDRWVGTTLKTNRRDIERAPGLRVALFPEERSKEGPKKDDNLIYCPLPYSGEFMQLFLATFNIVKSIVATKGKQPSRIALVHDDDQTVAKWLVDRSHFPVQGILEALDPLKQPFFLKEQEVVAGSEGNIIATAPIPKTMK
ncbi:MAG: hypothetical protein V4864_04855 [Pseudomonadota bacterium]